MYGRRRVYTVFITVSYRENTDDKLEQYQLVFMSIGALTLRFRAVCRSSCISVYCEIHICQKMTNEGFVENEIK